ncbi:MAG: hypothetical protein Q6J33_06205 [Gloeomargarita sp. DG_2_bins_126]
MSYDLTQSVRAFFQQFPWQGMVAPARHNGKAAWVCDLSLPVAQFWGQWPWQGMELQTEAEAGATGVSVPTLDEWMSVFGGT